MAVRFPDPNGGSMTVANESEARARGWTPSMGTFGVNSVSDAGSGLGNGSSTASTGPTQNQIDFARQSSGIDIKDLDERKRQFDAQLAFAREQWVAAGLPAAEVERRYREAQVQEIQNQIMLATANVTGTYGGVPTEAARQFNATQGLNYLQAAAQMGGPSDYFQQSNFFRGAQGNAQVPAFLSALQNGVTMAGFGATGTNAPVAQSPATLAQSMTGAPINPGAAAGIAQQQQATAQSAASRYPEGTFVKQSYGPGIGVVRGGQFVPFRSWEEYVAAGGPIGPDGWADMSRLQQTDQNGWDALTAAPAPTPAPAAPAGGQMGITDPGFRPGGGLTPEQIAQNRMQDTSLGLIGAIGRTGGTGLAPQALEQLTPDELNLFGSGLRASGFSMPSFLQSYNQSRVGQRAAVPLG